MSAARSLLSPPLPQLPVEDRIVNPFPITPRIPARLIVAPVMVGTAGSMPDPRGLLT
jgi:hypothetical protein